MSSKLTASEKRLQKDGTLLAALGLVFSALERMGEKIERIGDVAVTASGGTPSRAISTYFGGGIPWIKSGDLNDAIIDSIEESITEEGLAHSSAKMFTAGTLVVALYGATVGKTGILGKDAASNQAVCAVIPRSRDVSSDYLYWFLRHKRTEFLKASFGGAQPNISQNLLRATEISLPRRSLQDQVCQFFRGVALRQAGDRTRELPSLPSPLDSCRRIVAKVEELVAKIEEAKGLRESVNEDTSRLQVRASSVLFGNDKWPTMALEDVLRENSRNGLGVRPSDSQPGIPILRISAGTSRPDGVVDESDHKFLELSDNDANTYALMPGDLLACRFNGNLRFVGRFSLYMGYLGQRQVYPDKLIRFRVDESRVLPTFVRYAMNTTQSRACIESFCRTTAGNIGISATTLKIMPLAVPPLPEQRRIVAYLDDLQAKVDSLKALQTQSAAELDALLPSILDKAFKGEL